MSEFQGTEGQWFAVNGSSAGKQIISESAPKTRRNIASCGGPRRKYNALLIAAAPELLETCLRIQAQFRQAGIESKTGSLNPIEDNAAQIDAVILKALGQ